MNKTNYELHNLENAQSPFIFHYDIASNHSIEMANWHENIEIIFCTKGTGIVKCDSIEYNIKKDDIFVINSASLHAMYSIDDFEYYCLIIDSDFLKTNSINIYEIEFDSLVTCSEAVNLFKNIIASMKTKDNYKIASIKADVLKFTVYLARHFSHPLSSDKSTASSNENIKFAIDYIKANFTQKITLELAAAEAGISKYHFSREFKKSTGMTFVSYVNTLRCRHAKKLLFKRKYTIHDIAQKCGFENDSYFSKIFKQETGVRPSEFLENLKDNN